MKPTLGRAKTPREYRLVPRRAIVLAGGAALLSGPLLPWAKGQAKAAKILIPHASWNCGMSQGVPNPESGKLVFEVEIKLRKVADIGTTPYGSRRIAVGLEWPAR